MQATERKTIHIHVGPHKTGSTAIQHQLSACKAQLRDKAGIVFVQHKAIGSLAIALAKDDTSTIADCFRELNDLATNSPGDILISNEDLIGDLPGRTGKRRIYPQFWQRLNKIRKGLAPHNVQFYFFRRDKEAWLRSSYAQLLKFRTKFSSYDEYLSFLIDASGDWDEVIGKARTKLGNRFVEITYQESLDYSATDALMNVLAPEVGLTFSATERPNKSPSAEVMQLLETANKSGASIEAVRKAKQAILTPEKRTIRSELNEKLQWPLEIRKPSWLSSELEPLWARAEKRAQHQVQPYVLPDPDCDLVPFRQCLVEADEEFPEGGRQNMENQVRILSYRFKGLPETCLHLGLSISYLRRFTGLEPQASYMFQRLWDEEHEVLLGYLPTRWLISTFQTFMDHGINEDQKMIGSAAYFMSNTLKLYEAERALDGLAADRAYPSETPTTQSGFWGLDRFRVGGTDLMINSNALLLELASRDDRAGRVVQEFMLRMKHYNTAFSRMDKSRVEHDVDIPQFRDCWSFAKKPDLKE